MLIRRPHRAGASRPVFSIMMVWMWVVRLSFIVVLSVLFEILPQTDATEELFDFHTHAKQNPECEAALWHARWFSCQIFGVW